MKTNMDYTTQLLQKISCPVITLELKLSNIVILKQPRSSSHWNWMKPKRTERKTQKELHVTILAWRVTIPVISKKQSNFISRA